MSRKHRYECEECGVIVTMSIPLLGGWHRDCPRKDKRPRGRGMPRLLELEVDNKEKEG